VTAAPVLLVDNVDSFTFNVADLLHRVLGRPPTVWRNDHPATEEDLLGFAAIVVGPGPGRPQHPADLGLSAVALGQRAVPVLGICLGHQGLAHVAGDDVVELALPMHGRVSRVHHDGTGILAGVPSPFDVVRYHSLEVRLAADSPLQARAWAEDDGCVMVLSDEAAGRWGVQFHPESVLSEHGMQILWNFLVAAGVPVQPAPDQDPSPVAVGDVPVRLRQQGPDPRKVAVHALSVPGRVDGWRLHQRLAADGPTSFWLDSTAGERDGVDAVPAARFSVLGDGTGPMAYQLVHRVGHGTTVHAPGGTRHLPGPLLPNLQALLAEWELVEDVRLPTPFRPGFVGYLGYELKAETTPVAPSATSHASPHPDAWMVFADRAVVVDHHAGTVHAVYLADAATLAEQQAWAERVHRILVEESRRPRVPWPAPAPVVGDGAVARAMRHTEAEYVAGVATCQERIRAGETYEACLTTMVSWPAPVDEVEAYRQLRAASPVPFGAWLRAPGLSVLGASPERFLSVSPDGVVEARPIKGTRPRSPELAEDVALAADLAASVKDRAENLMIVDLLRNDLHRVCRSGSVHVPELFAVESYATVHQLVSTINGLLADGMGALDVLASCFPGGSMTGAPKVRTMEILDGLEGGPRGVYAGALGWVGLNGAMDTSIVIRTATVADGAVRFGIGGAVTALSDPAEELAEALHKGRALAAALTAAGPPGAVGVADAPQGRLA
jgi:para-aminobenzoate synthetase